MTVTGSGLHTCRLTLGDVRFASNETRLQSASLFVRHYVVTT